MWKSTNYNGNYNSNRDKKYEIIGYWYFSKGNDKIICSKVDKINNIFYKWIYNPFRKTYELYYVPCNKIHDDRHLKYIMGVYTFNEIVQYCIYK